MTNKHEIGCWRCGSKNYPQVAARQLSGYNCQVCHDCANEWSLFIDDHPAATAQHHAEMRQLDILARTGHDGVSRTEELFAAAKDYRMAAREKFNLAQSWVAGEYEKTAE